MHHNCSDSACSKLQLKSSSTPFPIHIKVLAKKKERKKWKNLCKSRIYKCLPTLQFGKKLHCPQITSCKPWTHWKYVDLVDKKIFENSGLILNTTWGKAEQLIIPIEAHGAVEWDTPVAHLQHFAQPAETGPPSSWVQPHSQHERQGSPFSSHN